jgi:hypothetical protein
MSLSARRFGYGLLVAMLLSSFSALGQAPSRSSKAPLPAHPEQEQRDDPAGRQAWFLRGRMVAGKNAAALLHRAFQQKMALRRAQQQAAARTGNAPAAAAGGVGILSGPAWTNLGPAPITGNSTGTNNPGFSGNPQGNFSGRIQAVVVDPNDATGNTVYVGSAYGGVWKSTNAATANHANVTWTPLFDTDPAAATLSVGAVTVLPCGGPCGAHGPIILVGTGEPDNAVDSYYGQGILRFDPVANAWSLIASADSGTHGFKGTGFSKIAFSTATPSLVVAANGSTFPIGLQNFMKGLYFSTDSGATWSLASISDPGPTPICNTGLGCSVSDVVFDPANGTFYAAVRFHGFYSSTNGQTWTRVADMGLTISTANCTGTSVCPMFRGQLAVQPNTGDLYTVYISGNNTANDTTPLIFRAAFTSGTVSSWTQLSNQGITACGDGTVNNGCGASQGFYDLYIAALPDGANTDLYFAAVNLFKCSLSGAQTCNVVGGTSNTWMNITHVYNQACSNTYQTMHPDNHALGFMVVGANILTYFGNDGGVYRSLNSANLIGHSIDNPAGTLCSGNGNALDDLNTASLGSLTQFMAISTDPVDASVTLGGTQDNGSPATAGGQTLPVLTPPLWFEANGGDGGFNFIDHTGNNWYTAFTDVSIQRCNSLLDTTPNFPNPQGPGPGTNCIEIDGFQDTVTNTQVGGDHGAFYTPYMLDPANDTNVIVGTCRVWRGVANVPPTSLTVLSNNFDTASNATCTGNEGNMIASLAAGGPTDANGLSKVIYAGSDIGTVFASTNASGGVGTFISRSLLAGVPVAGLAIDATDSTGQTAYATVQGFTGGAQHVWKTTNAGVNWTDITGNLPDAPANSVVVDPVNHNVIYVGTDVGVFMTNNGGATWSEYGTGFPNVAVLSLATGPDHTLRAGTHGRGVFQIPLASASAYTLAIANTPKTVYVAGLPAIFSGAASTSSGFSSLVDLTCTAGGTAPPATCTPSPTPITPSAGAGTPLTVSTSGAVGDYSFNLHGVGQDAGHSVADAALTLHVVDFSLGAAPNPVNIPHDNSGTVTVTVTAAGTLTDTVHLTCRTPLPTGITCGFSQNDFVPSGAGTNVTLTIFTTAATAVGSPLIHVDVTPSSPGAPTKTQDVTVNVTSNPDFSFSAASLTPSSVRVNQGSSGAVTLAAQDGFASTVDLSCSVLPAGPTCSALTPPSLTPPNGATFSVSVGTGTPQNYLVTVTGTSTSPAQMHSVNLAYSIWDYSVAAPAGFYALSGLATNIGFTLHPLNGQQNVDVSCTAITNMPGATCSIVQGTTPVVNPVSLAGGDVQLIALLTLPAGPSPCSISHCSITLHTVDHDVPTAPARDKVINIFAPVVRASDFSGDHKADILWRNSSTGDIALWLMNGTSFASGGTIYSGAIPAWQIVGVGDFNGDGRADLLWRNTATGDIAFWMMNGTAILSSGTVYSGAVPQWQIMAVADFDGDGKADILWRNIATGDVAIWLMNGTAITSGGTIVPGLDPNLQFAGVGDLTGDGKADILWRNTSTGDITLWVMNGMTKVSETVVSAATDPNLQIVGVADFDGNGKADILWRNISTGDITLWLMNGATHVGGGTVYAGASPAWQIVGVGDFNNDGKADILWRNTSTGDIAIWLMNGPNFVSGGTVYFGALPAWQILSKQ